MKKFCLLLVLSSILLLTSCSLGGGHMPGSIFDDDKTAANTRIEKLLEAIKSKNGDIVKSMFSKNAIADANNIDENIFKLFNCFKGEILSYEDWGGPGVSQGNNDDGSGRIWKILRSTYDVKTSEKALSEKYDLKEVVNILNKNGYTYEKDGATWFKCSALFDDKDHVLIKEDGNATYFLPDIAYHMDKINRGFDKMIDIFGADHHGYVARLKSSVKALGNDPEKLEVKLLQLVRLVENGEVVKMSKRTGKSVTLKELIDEVGVNAARYYFSKYSLDTQMDFDLGLAKSKSNENPVFYVSYAYARICSILKGQENVKKCEKYIAIKDDTSYNVLEKVYEFPEVVKTSATKELPHLITNYVYELASLFHLYYAKNRVLTDDEEETLENLNLIKCVKQTLFNALDLIGVIPPEQM